jgi:DnaK suppressor protein
LFECADAIIYHPHPDLCAMAAKKTTSKTAAQKGKAKPAVKPSKPEKLSKSAPLPKTKSVVAKSVSPSKPVKVAKKESAPKKSANVAHQASAAKKDAPLLKKTTAEPPVKKASPPAKPAAEVSAKAAATVKKVAPAKPRSSVVDFPAPPAPVRPPFIPPKAAPTPADGPVAPGSNGSHSAAFVQKQRQRLLDLRDELVDAVSGMARDTIRNAPEGSEASGSGQHQGDAGSDAYDRDFALSVLAKEQDALYEIEQALYRIKIGSYGICEISARKIPQARLEAIPFARLTVECQTQWEKEYGNRRFRPSNEVGFSGGKYVEDEDSETVSLDEDDD